MSYVKKPNGYMTLEASLIMPFVLYICLLIIYTGFFLYDRCIFMQDCYRIALRGSSVYRDNNQDVYNTAYAYLDKITPQKYITKNYEFNIQVDKGVTVKASGKYVMPFYRMLWLEGNETWTVNLEAESKCINPTIVIRLCRELQDNSSKREK